MVEIPRSSSDKTALQVAQEVARRAGETLLRRFDRPMTVSFKGRGDVVTDVDSEVERETLSALRSEFPGMGTLGEESAGVAANDGYVWIVDPLDGTRNYASGIPFYSAVVGLALDGEVLVGVTYDPARDEMFYAERGAGAFLNDEPIRVSDKPGLEDCIVGLDLSNNNEGAVNGLDLIRSIWPSIQTARIMGSAALGIAYVAAGRTDLYFHHQLQPWDQVAGMLLTEEAGGVVTDRTGERAGLHGDGLIASSAAVHAEFMRRTDGLAWRAPTHALA